MSEQQTKVVIGKNKCELIGNKFWHIKNDGNRHYRDGLIDEKIDCDSRESYENIDDLCFFADNYYCFNTIDEAREWILDNCKPYKRKPMFMGDCGNWIYTLDEYYKCRLSGYESNGKRSAIKKESYTKMANKLDGYAYFSTLHECELFLQAIWSDKEDVPLFLDENGFMLYFDKPFWCCSRTGFDDDGEKDVCAMSVRSVDEGKGSNVDIAYFNNEQSCNDYLLKAWSNHNNTQKKFVLDVKYDYNTLIAGAYEKISLGLLDDAIKILIHAQLKLKTE